MNNEFKLLVKRDHDDVVLPKYEKDGDAGMDIRAYTDGVLKPGEHKLFKSGLRVALPPGVVMDVRPRSGLAYKNLVTVLNSPGTVDSGYRGDVGIILINLGKEDFVVEKGDRIAQLVFLPFLKAVPIEVKDFDEITDRKDGGFGSTGIK